MQGRNFAKYVLLVLMAVSIAGMVHLTPSVYAQSPIASFTYSPTSPSVGYATTFDASNSSSPKGIITNYAWNFGDGNTATSSNPTTTHVYNAAGMYWVQLEVTDNYTMIGITTQSVQIYPAIPWLVAQFPQQLILSNEFVVSININHLAEAWQLFGLQFNLNYDSNLLQFVNVSAGSFWNSFNWASDQPYTYAFAQTHTGFVTAEIGLLAPSSEPTGYVFPNGDGTVALMIFRTTSNVQQGTVYPITFSIDNVVMGSFSAIEFPHYDSAAVNYRIRIDSPVAQFTYSSLAPVTGEQVTFDASSSYSTSVFGGSITNYVWNFGDGTFGSGMVVTHAFAQPETYNVVLTVTDNNGNSQNVTQQVIVARSFVTVNVDTSSTGFPGELLDFYVQTSILGNPVNVDSEIATLYYGSQQLDLSPQVQHIGTGLYKVSYTIPSNAYNGTWSFVANVNYLSMSGTGMQTFLVSPTLTNWNAQLIAVSNNIATLQTSVGFMRANLTAINAQLVGVNNNMATIQTNVGIIQANLTAINAKIVNISNGVATITTDLGTIKANIANLQNTVSNPAPTTNDMGYVAPILYIVVIFSAIAAVIASLIYFLPRRTNEKYS